MIGLGYLLFIVIFYQIGKYGWNNYWKIDNDKKVMPKMVFAIIAILGSSIVYIGSGAFYINSYSYALAFPVYLGLISAGVLLVMASIAAISLDGTQWKPIYSLPLAGISLIPIWMFLYTGVIKSLFNIRLFY